MSLHEPNNIGNLFLEIIHVPNIRVEVPAQLGIIFKPLHVITQ